MLVIVDLKSNEHTTKQGNAPRKRTRKDSNQSFIVFGRVKSIEARKRTLDGLKSFAITKTNSQKKITHELQVGKSEKDTKRYVGPNRSRADLLATLRQFREVKQEAAEAGHQFNPTTRRDNAEGNNSSNTKILQQIMPPRQIRSSYKQCGQSVAWSTSSSSSSSHGGHLQDGKSGECIFL